MINLIVVDGDELSRLGLTQIFTSSNQINLIKVISNSKELEVYSSQKRIDVVLFDYTSTGFGITDIKMIKKMAPNAALVAITPEQNVLSIQHALMTGIQGYVKKSCAVQEIVDCVVSLYEGKPFFCGDIVDLLNEHGLSIEGLEDRMESCDPVTVSKRELEIIQLIASGYTNPMIAKKLFLSNHTVNAHKKNIFGKLGVNNTTSVVMYAVKNGIINPDEFLFPADVSIN